MKRILITGGAGFIGTNLCKELVENKANYIYCLDNFYTGKMNNISELLSCSNFELIEDDITDLHFDYPIDEIYNLACPASPPAYQANPIKTFETSIVGVHNLIKLAIKYNAKILQASTSEVYGNPIIHPQNEEYWGNVNPIGIRSCYDEGKRGAECLLSDYHRMGLKAIIVRIFNTYGPYMDKKDGRVISNFINQSLQNKPITIYGQGTQTRSFCFVKDLVNGLIKAMDIAEFGPINLGNPIELNMIQLAEKILRLADSKSEIIFQNLPEDDPCKRKPDIRKASEILEWHPIIGIDEGLSMTIDYYRRNLCM